MKILILVLSVFVLGFILGTYQSKTVVVTHYVQRDCDVYNKLFGGMPWKEVCR